MNVYDFDKTIFYPDSSYKFILYSVKKYPRYFLRLIPKLLKCSSVTEFKELLFGVISYIPDIDSYVKDFWDLNFCRIQNWYLKMHKDDDLIISASPDFLIKEAAKRLNCRYIATPMSRNSGLILGNNCHDKEKLRRFNLLFNDELIDEFYSDSLSDAPLACISKKAFLVKKNKITEWP